MQSWLRAEPKWGQVSRCEKIVPFLFENGMPKSPTLQGMGPDGHSHEVIRENAEGTFFFARDGKKFHSGHAGICIRAKDTCALEAWPVHRCVSKCQTNHHQTHAEECRYRAQISRRHIASCASASVCACLLLRNGTTPLVCRAGLLLAEMLKNVGHL